MIWLSIVCVLATAVRRWRHGPRRPTWTFRFEVVVALMRRNWDTLQHWPIERVRAHLDGLPPPKDALRAVSREPVRFAPGDDGEPSLTGVRTAPSSARDDWRAGDVILYLHGGSFLYGSTRTHADIMARLALAAEAPVVGIDYRLAPEHPPTAALDDATAAYRWLLEQHIPAERIVVAGDSAGGSLALGLLARVRDEGLARPRAGLLISPWLDLTCSRPSMQRNADYDTGTSAMLREQARMYAGERPLDDPAISRLSMDVAGLPPLLVQVGGAELLEDQCSDFVQRARARGADVSLDVLVDMPHAAQLYAAYAPEGARALERAGAFIKESVAVEAALDDANPPGPG